jgi:endonuclease YncB( thermonuclease family)
LHLILAIILILLQSIALADTLRGRVLRVTDGDIVVVLDSNHNQNRVRLAGIDAPERSQAYGKTSKKHLTELVYGETVVIEYDKYDRYGRIVGRIILDGYDMNLEQIKAGLAWHHKKYQDEQSSNERLRYAETEVEAKNNMRGLWYDPDPIPPWDYRRGTRGYIKSVAQRVKSGHNCGTKRYCR